MKMPFLFGAAALALLPAAGLAERIYAVDEVGNLIRFESAAPEVIQSLPPLAGLELVAMAVATGSAGQGVVEIPALGPWGLFFLTAGLGVAGMSRLRRRRPARR